MPLDTSLEGIRKTLVTQLHGRRIGLAPGNNATANVDPNFLGGIKAVREQVEGVSSAGSTITSTSVGTNLSAYGISLVGSSGASATTAYNLDAPIPGVKKGIFNPTTGQANIGTTAAGAFICSTGSVTSTHGNIFLVGKGAFVELWGLTTALWGLAENLAITTVTTGNLVQIS